MNYPSSQKDPRLAQAKPVLKAYGGPGAPCGVGMELQGRVGPGLCCEVKAIRAAVGRSWLPRARQNVPGGCWHESGRGCDGNRRGAERMCAINRAHCTSVPGSEQPLELPLPCGVAYRSSAETSGAPLCLQLKA